MRWVLAAVLAAAGTLATVVKALGWNWPWLAVTAVAVTAVLAVPNTLLLERLKRRDQRKDEHRRELAVQSVGGGRGTIRDVSDPTVLGVHRALDLDTPPPYIRRDKHASLVELLRPGTFALVIGDSGAGKSRLAYETVLATIPHHRLFAPEPVALGTAIEQLLQTRRAVLWLDDLERFLDGDTLTATSVDNLLGEERIVIATLRLQEWETAVATKADSSLAESRRRVLAMAKQVHIDKRFSDTELATAETVADDRIAEALSHADKYGVAEYLAAGPQLLDRWQKGKTTHPRGSAFVAAAVDCRRAGYLSPIPKALLEEIHARYLPDSCRPESIEDAWLWATALWRDCTALLEPVGEEVTVFDYVVDHEQRTRPFDHSLEDVVHAAIRHGHVHDVDSMGIHALREGRSALALLALNHVRQRRMALLGPEHEVTLASRNNFAYALNGVGRPADALTELRAVLDVAAHALSPEHPLVLTFRTHLVDILRELGLPGEVVAEQRALVDTCERVLGTDDKTTLAARKALAIVLAELGRHEEALFEQRAVVSGCTRVVGGEHPTTLHARNALAGSMAALGRLEEAAAELRATTAICVRVLGPDHPGTVTYRGNLAVVLGLLGDLEGAATQGQAVVDAMSRVRGVEHPDTLKFRYNLALTHQELGLDEQAVTEFHAVHDGLVRVYGLAHPLTRQCRVKLVNALRAIGDDETADQLRDTAHE